MAKVRLLQDGKYAQFWCPGCNEIHMVKAKPVDPNGWEFNGNVDAPTFSPSVMVRGGGSEDRRCHSFVRDGKIEFLTDCSHPLAGKTVPLPEFDKATAD